MHIRSISVVAAALLTLAACGSDDTNEPADTDATTTTIEQSSTTEHDMADMEEHGDHGEHDHEAEATGVAKPLPTLPDGTLDPAGVDLSGVEGVTAEQQAYAEDLLVRSIETLPKWANYDDAIADGYLSIGDELTGEEHVIKWDTIDDDNWLDPNEPESLVYKVVRNADGTTTKTLEAAMFLLPDEFDLDNAPDDGGALMQYHMHDDLCFTDFPQPLVRGLRPHGGECKPPLVAFDPNIMVHVWIRPNSCGPFAALQGVGGGQIKTGEEVSCLHEHGSEVGL